MVELLSLKEFLFLFVFGNIETFIILMFCKEIGKIGEINYKYIIPLTFIMTIGRIFTIPFLKHIIFTIIIIIYFYITSKKRVIYLIKIYLYSSMYLLIFETMASILFIILLSMDLSNLSIYLRVIYLLPIRIIQIITIHIIRRKEWVIFGGAQ